MILELQNKILFHLTKHFSYLKKETFLNIIILHRQHMDIITKILCSDLVRTILQKKSDKEQNQLQTAARLHNQRSFPQTFYQALWFQHLIAGSVHPSHREACGRFNWPHSTLPPLGLCRIHFKLLFSLLTKPLIHPETGGQVSAGARGWGGSRHLTGTLVSDRKGFHTESPELSWNVQLTS